MNLRSPRVIGRCGLAAMAGSIIAPTGVARPLAEPVEVGRAVPQAGFPFLRERMNARGTRPARVTKTHLPGPRVARFAGSLSGVAPYPGHSYAEHARVRYGGSATGRCGESRPARIGPSHQERDRQGTGHTTTGERNHEAGRDCDQISGRCTWARVPMSTAIPSSSSSARTSPRA